jgi:hypothetical protein
MCNLSLNFVEMTVGMTRHYVIFVLICPISSTRYVKLKLIENVAELHMNN